jgi:deaminated glutathione amidase
VRAAAIQLNATDDVDRNLKTADRLVRQAARYGAELVVLPETWTVMGAREQMIAGAQALDGQAISWARAIAAELGIDLIAGSLSERRAGVELLSNTSVHVDPRGEIAAIYRKIHLFDVDVPGGKRYRESEAIEPGADTVVATTPWGGLGLSICYDLRFPELYRALAAGGARIAAVPSAFTLETGKDHWHTLLRARAIENQLYVFAPAQFGAHGPTRRSYGHALVVDPWGAVIAECGDHEGVALAQIDLGYQDRVRAAIPCLVHRRL